MKQHSFETNKGMVIDKINIEQRFKTIHTRWETKQVT